MTFKEKLQCSDTASLAIFSFCIRTKGYITKVHLVFLSSFTRLSLNFSFSIFSTFLLPILISAFKGNSVSEGVISFHIVN